MTFLFALLLSNRLAAEPIVQIPFEFTGDHVFVEVGLDGQTLSFAFDTGAGGVGINLATAKRLGLEETGSGSVTGAAGTTRVPFADGLTLRLGELCIQRVNAALVALDHLEERVGRPVDGIIGQDVLRGRLVLLDHDRRVLEVHERRSFPFAEWGSPCTLERTGPLEVEGEIQLLAGEFLPGRFNVDSGAGSFLVLNSMFAARHGLVDRVGPTHARKGRALTAVTTADRVGRVAGIKFCGHEFPSLQSAATRAAATGSERGPTTVPAILSGATAGVLARGDQAGLIGNAVLRRFNLVFDLDRGRIYLRPNSHWDDPVRTDASGLALIRRDDGTVLIDDVVAASPAAETALEPGDELRSIDGVDLGMMTLAELRERLKEPDRSFRLVVVRNGEASTVGLHSRALLTP